MRELGVFPTPLERVPGLPNGVELWVKREDLAGARYGGNKVRKLELLLADPRVQPGARLVTFGAYGSNHILATALYGRALGCEVEAVVFPQPPGAWVTRSVAAQLGAGLTLLPCRSYLGLPGTLWRAQRGRPAPVRIPAGGSSPLGTLGWVDGGLEIAAQAGPVTGAPRFDAVYCALGSGGMAAGLWLGLGDAAAELVAVRVVPWPVGSAAVIRVLARRAAALLARNGAVLPASGPRPRLRVDGRFLGRGYGHATAASQAAVARAAELGIKLEPTYTGKTFAALLADAESGRLRNKRVLFVSSWSSADLDALRAQADWTKLPDWYRARVGG